MRDSSWLRWLRKGGVAEGRLATGEEERRHVMRAGTYYAWIDGWSVQVCLLDAEWTLASAISRAVWVPVCVCRDSRATRHGRLCVSVCARHGTCVGSPSPSLALLAVTCLCVLPAAVLVEVGLWPGHRAPAIARCVTLHGDSVCKNERVAAWVRA